LLKEVKNIFSKYYQMIKLPFKIFKQACEMLELLDHKQFLLVSLPHFLSPFLPPLFPSIKHLFLHVHTDFSVFGMPSLQNLRLLAGKSGYSDDGC
jgi:hypothetical protein